MVRCERGVLLSGKETGDIPFCREPDFNSLEERFKAALVDIIGAETADTLPPFKYWATNTLLFGMDIRAAYIPELFGVFARTDLPARNLFPPVRIADSADSKGLIKPDIGSYYNTKSMDTLLKIAEKSDLIRAGKIDYKGLKEDILPGTDDMLRLYMLHNHGELAYVMRFMEKLGAGMGHTEACLNPLVVTDAFIQAYVDTIGIGDFYTVDAALNKIERDIPSAKNRAALRNLVTLIGEKGSVPAAREATGDLGAFRDSLQLLRDTGINGAPLSKDSGLDCIKNPFAEVYEHCTRYASGEVKTERRPDFKYKIKKTAPRKSSRLQPVTLKPLGEAATVAYKQGRLPSSEEEQRAIEWLLKCGGPAVRLRMATAGMISQDTVDRSAAAQELMQLDPVSKTLDFLDRFDEYRTIERPWDKLIHNCFKDCYETYMPFLEDIGLYKGILPVFDAKMEKLREVYDYLFQTQHDTGKVLIHMLKTGFCYSDMEALVLKRLNKVYPVTQANRFDFFETDPGKIRQPKRWLSDRYQILKDEFNPYEPPKNGDAWLPLPDSYDMQLFISFYPYTENPETREKINAIMQFYLDPRYQVFGGDYGWHYSFVKNTYHASSGGVPLPFYDSDEPSRHHFLWVMEELSLSRVLCQAAWYKKGLDYCEKYKTDRYTYLFPAEFIHPSKKTCFNELYIASELLPTLKPEERKALALENLSTLMVTLLKMRGKAYVNS